MRYFREMRRQRIVERLTQNLSPRVKECTHAAMMLTYTDDQLRTTDSWNYSRRDRRDLQEKLLGRWDSEPVVDHSEKATHFYQVNKMIEEFISSHHSDISASAYCRTLSSLAVVIDSVKEKYGDPSNDGHQAAMDSGAEFVLTIQRAMTHVSGYTDMRNR